MRDNRDVIVDPEDQDLVDRWGWNLNKDGYVFRMLYPENRMQFLHREILGFRPGDPVLVDHINRDKLDNRRENLRVATRSQNAQNRDPVRSDDRFTSRYRGVCRRVRRGRVRWHAQARVDYHVYHLGYFDTEEEAAARVMAWRTEHMPWAES